MAEPQNDPARRPPDFRVQVTESLAGLVDFSGLVKGYNWVVAIIVKALTTAIEWTLFFAIKLIAIPLRGLARGEDRAEAAFGELAAVAVEDLFGVSVNAGAMTGRGKRGARTDAARAIGRAVMQALTNGGDEGQRGELTPSKEGAERYLSMVTQLALEGWLEGWLIEASTLGQLETFGELDDIMAQVLGLGRMTRAVTRPLMDARVITPLEWHVNKTYHPKLLSPAEAARQIARGRGNRETWLEDLRRQGYDEQRIEAILNAQAKFHSVGDVDLLTRAGGWNDSEAIKHLRDQGYDESTARNELVLENLRRQASIERQMAALAVDALSEDRVSLAEAKEFIEGNTVDATERQMLYALAGARRAMRARHLSSPEVERAIRAGILAFVDYRRALDREGYTDEAITVKELLLRHELDEKAELDELRARRAAELDAERAKRDEAAAARRVAVEADRALDRRGRESDLERAAVRGLIPLARYEEVIAARYDPDTVAILVADVEGRRVGYVAEQNQRADAAGRAALKRLNVGQLERAVLADELTIIEFGNHPTLQQLDDADRDVLTRTLSARLEDLRAAKARRVELEGPAAERQIDLPRFEALVLRGIRSLDDYRGRLDAAGFADEDVAALVELLAVKLTERHAAADARAAADVTPPLIGPTVEQFRRAVVRGVRTLDEFAAFLLERRLTPDAQRLIIDDLAAELTEVEAARARREQAETVSGAPGLSLATLERAARLGVLSIDDYRAALEGRGLDELDVEISMELLVLELQTVAAARVRRDAIDRELAPKQLSVSTMVRAMKAGLKTSEDLRALLVAAGYGPADVDVQVKLAEDEVAQTKAAIERRGRIAERVSGAGLSLDALEADVLRGARSIDAYVAELVGLGVTAAEAGVLVGLLVDRLTEAAV